MHLSSIAGSKVYFLYFEVPKVKDTARHIAADQ